jgi:hypothetical protein
MKHEEARLLYEKLQKGLFDKWAKTVAYYNKKERLGGYQDVLYIWKREYTELEEWYFLLKKDAEFKKTIINILTKQK